MLRRSKTCSIEWRELTAVSDHVTTERIVPDTSPYYY